MDFLRVIMACGIVHGRIHDTNSDGSGRLLLDGSHTPATCSLTMQPWFIESFLILDIHAKAKLQYTRQKKVSTEQ